MRKTHQFCNKMLSFVVEQCFGRRAISRNKLLQRSLLQVKCGRRAWYIQRHTREQAHNAYITQKQLALYDTLQEHTVQLWTNYYQIYS